MSSTKILQEFKNLKLNIISEQKLIEYIEFCLYNNNNTKTIGVTEHHHILPKADDLFPQFINLSKHSWNGTHLSYKNHYIAHSMLCEAISHKSISFVWNIMNNKFTKPEQKDIIGEAQYKLNRERHSRFVSEMNIARANGTFIKKKRKNLVTNQQL